jgi:ribonuclease T1
MRQRLALRKLVLGFCAAVLLGLLSAAPVAHAFSQEPGAAEIVHVQALPHEARETLRLIRAGGPFPYAHKDGSVFSNRERVLPRRPRGFYHEYTVVTPGAHDRGARRIITGPDAVGDVEGRAEYWYTDDHYRSFRRITGLAPNAEPHR